MATEAGNLSSSKLWPGARKRIRKNHKLLAIYVFLSMKRILLNTKVVRGSEFTDPLVKGFRPFSCFRPAASYRVVGVLTIIKMNCD